MAIRYTLDHNSSGKYCVYEGDTYMGTPLYYIDDKPPVTNENFSLRVRRYSDNKVIYTIIKNPSNTNDLLVYRGASVVYGNPIDYYYQEYSPYCILREGSSPYGKEVYRVYKNNSGRLVVDDGSAGGGTPYAYTNPSGSSYSGNAGSSNSGAGGEIDGATVLLWIGIAAFVIYVVVGSGILPPILYGFVLFAACFGFGLFLKEKIKKGMKNKVTSNNPNYTSQKQKTNAFTSNSNGNEPVNNGYQSANKSNNQPALLPVGTIVTLKNASVMFMIVGHNQKNSDTASAKVYEYGATIYPDGNMASNLVYMFDNADIAKIVHKIPDSVYNSPLNQYSTVLPLGSIIKLNYDSKYYIIAGYKSLISGKNNPGDVVYDYKAYGLPYGMRNSNEYAVFNHVNISGVLYRTPMSNDDYTKLLDKYPLIGSLNSK